MRSLNTVLGFVFLLLYLSSQIASGSEENDLWLLLSTYEDIGINPNDLAFFLATHGYNAEPHGSYVTVKFSSGREVYLTPNGAQPRLADLWMTPPSDSSGPTMVLPEGAVKVNETYQETSDADFVKTITRYTIFPVTPLGECFDGSQKLSQIYGSFGHTTLYMYDPSAGGYDRGHLWILVKDKDGKWLAADSYYGIMTDKEYYFAPYSFSDIKYLDSVNPQWKVA